MWLQIRVLICFLYFTLCLQGNMKMYKKTFCTKILFSNKIYKRKIFVPKAYSLNKLTRTFMFPANLMTRLSLRFT